MTAQPTYFRKTTAQQRRLLFETWQSTGSVKIACEAAHVSKRVFYRWKSRFDACGYSALEDFQSHAPKNPKRVSQEIASKVISLKREHPQWGKKRIADELAKTNSWVRLVSHNTIKRILCDAGLWPDKAPEKKNATCLSHGG
jgi:transposase